MPLKDIKVGLPVRVVTSSKMREMGSDGGIIYCELGPSMRRVFKSSPAAIWFSNRLKLSDLSGAP